MKLYEQYRKEINLLEIIGLLITLLLFGIMLLLANGIKDIHAMKVLTQESIERPMQVSSCDAYKALCSITTTEQPVKLTTSKI